MVKYKILHITQEGLIYYKNAFVSTSNAELNFDIMGI